MSPDESFVTIFTHPPTFHSVPQNTTHTTSNGGLILLAL